MKNKDGKITIKSIYSFLRDKKNKKYSFFIFYFFFFIFFAIFIGSAKNIDTNNDNNNLNQLPFAINHLENNYYNISYTINYDNNIFKYTGIKDNNNVILKDKNNAYKYLYQNNVLTNLNEINNDLIIYKLLDIYNLEKIITNSNFDYKTEFQNKENLYGYNISNKELISLINNNSDDILNTDLLNKIEIKTNSNNQIYSIKFNLLNYFNSFNNIDTLYQTYDIEILYNFGDLNE